VNLPQLSHKKPQEERRTAQRGNYAKTHFSGRPYCARCEIAQYEERGAPDRTRRQECAVHGSEHQAHRVRDYEAHESNQSRNRNRRTGQERGRGHENTLRRFDVYAHRRCVLFTKEQQIQHARLQERRSETYRDERC
jgi:hypothetical protein